MSWTDSLSASSGDFSTILSLLTQENGETLENIYFQFQAWCDETPQESTVAGFTAINSIGDLISTDTYLAVEATASAIATLQSLGLIKVKSGHLAPTQFGVEFLAAMNA